MANGDLGMRMDALEKHMDERFDAMHLLLLQLQSDLRMFYRELGYQDARLDNLEGRQ